MWSRHIVVDVDRDQSWAWQGTPRHGAAARRHESVVVGWSQKTSEGSHGFAVFREVEVVAPTSHCPVLGCVVARQRLLVALEHFGNLHHIGQVNVGQHVHQLLETVGVVVVELCVLQLAISPTTFVGLQEVVEEPPACKLEHIGGVGDLHGLGLGLGECISRSHRRLRLSHLVCKGGEEGRRREFG